MAQPRFQLIKRIARGGMAEIFLGRAVDSKDPSRIVAIKRILPHYAQDEEFLQMFRDEAAICKRLTHTNIVQVFSFEEMDESFALVMEFVNGSDLRSILSACEKQKRRISIPMSIHISAAIARGLHYAHTKVDDTTGQPLGIVHRDVSPQNILVSYEGEVKITDFGIADAKNKQTETKPGIVKGKYSYMSPEQVNAEVPDHRSDVFSLAIVLWEALSMRRLFASDNEIETIRLVQNCRIPYRLRDVNPEIHPDLEAVVEKGLCKDRRKRYQSAGDLERDLQHHLQAHYPSFTPSELGSFLTRLFPDKRKETQQEIKNALNRPVSSGGYLRDVSAGARDPSSTGTGVGTGIGSGSSSFPAALGTGSGKILPMRLSSPSLASGISAGLKNAPSNTSASAQSLAAQSLSAQLPLPAQSAVTDLPGLSRLPSGSVPSQSAASGMGNSFRGSAQSLRGRSSQPGRSQGHPRSRSGRRFHWDTWNISAVGMIAFGIILASYFASKRNFSAAEMPMSLFLKTIPASVMINIDGQDFDGGRYQQTPLKMNIPPGNRRIRLLRHGYLPEVIDIEGVGGSSFREDRVVMRKSSKSRFSPVRISVVPVHARVPLTIDEGFTETEAPVTVSDLEAGRSHGLVFYPSGDRRRGPPFRCTIATPANAALISIRLDVSARQSPRCTVVPNP